MQKMSLPRTDRYEVNQTFGGKNYLFLVIQSRHTGLKVGVDPPTQCILCQLWTIC